MMNLEAQLLKYNNQISTKTNDNDKADDEFSEWEEDNENNEDKSKYWFTRDKMDKIQKYTII